MHDYSVGEGGDKTISKWQRQNPLQFIHIGWSWHGGGVKGKEISLEITKQCTIWISFF